MSEPKDVREGSGNILAGLGVPDAEESLEGRVGPSQR
jgi:hypothetical protein